MNKKEKTKRATLAILCEAFPDCFSLESPKPLKIGIREDMIAGLAARDIVITKNKFSDAIAYYANSTLYLRKHVAGAARIDLNGNASGEVTQLQQAAAERRIEQIKAKAELKEKNRLASMKELEEHRKKQINKKPPPPPKIKPPKQVKVAPPPQKSKPAAKPPAKAATVIVVKKKRTFSM